MVHCPKCSSPIGEDMSVCPICRQAFSDEEKAAMADEKTAEERRIREGQRKAFEDFRRKRDIFTIAAWIAVVAVPAAVFAVAELTRSGTGVLIALGIGALLWVGIIVGGIVSGAARCPHCGCLLFRQYGPYCQSCGGKLQ